MDNLTAVSIDELNKANETYIIPKIQRGYRWTDKQIKELIDDITNFFELKESFYCLQPLIVQKSNNGMNVIDGQQRLVTMYLISYYLFERSNRFAQLDKGIEEPAKYDAKIQYKIVYENENKSIYDILNTKNNNTKISLTEKYVIDGYKFISKLLDENREKYKNIRKLDLSEIEQMLSRVKFIYYELEEKANEVEIFTNVNIGKLPLNTAEKIKGLMLKSDNFNINNTDKDIKNQMISELTANQEMIVEEWSEIEHKLQDNVFFYFFTQNYNQTIRINLLFDLFAEIDSSDEEKKNLDTFIYVENYLKEKPIKDINTLREFWQKIKEIYYILLSWYTDDNLYHYVGYLIYFAENNYISLIVELLKKYKESSKEEFFTYLHNRIKKDLQAVMSKPLEELCYEDEDGHDRDKKTIKRILLLFNIENILQNFKYNNIDSILKNEIKFNERFSFKRFKDSDYQLEHIHSQCDNIQDIVEWFETLYKYKDTLAEMSFDASDEKAINQRNLIRVFDNIDKNDGFLKKNDQTKVKVLNKTLHDVYYPSSTIENIIDNDDMINEVIQGIVGLYTDDNIENYKHKICNLTLLDAKTNAAYGNKIFPIKVLFIKNINTTTRFIPVATRNTMLKYYTDNPQHNLCWNKDDMESYINKIHLYLSFYLEKEDNNV